MNKDSNNLNDDDNDEFEDELHNDEDILNDESEEDEDDTFEDSDYEDDEEDEENEDYRTPWEKYEDEKYEDELQELEEDLDADSEAEAIQEIMIRLIPIFLDKGKTLEEVTTQAFTISSNVVNNVNNFFEKHERKFRDWDMALDSMLNFISEFLPKFIKEGDDSEEAIKKAFKIARLSVIKITKYLQDKE